VVSKAEPVRITFDWKEERKKDRKKERAFYVYDDDGCSIAAVTYLTNAIREDRFGNFHRELDGFIVVVCM